MISSTMKSTWVDLALIHSMCICQVNSVRRVGDVQCKGCVLIRIPALLQFYSNLVNLSVCYEADSTMFHLVYAFRVVLCQVYSLSLLYGLSLAGVTVWWWCIIHTVCDGEKILAVDSRRRKTTEKLRVFCCRTYHIYFTYTADVSFCNFDRYVSAHDLLREEALHQIGIACEALSSSAWSSTCPAWCFRTLAHIKFPQNAFSFFIFAFWHTWKSTFFQDSFLKSSIPVFCSKC